MRDIVGVPPLYSIDLSLNAMTTQSHYNKSSIPAFGDIDKDVHWFPLRVAYNHLLEVKKQLDELKIESFIPTEEQAEAHAEGYKKVDILQIDDLIFVHSTKAILTEIKHRNKKCRHLRFVTFIPYSEKKVKMTRLELCAVNRILVIPNSEMEEFIHAVNEYRNKVQILPYSEIFNHIGRKIRILEGPLAGSIGTLRRIKNNKHVHIDCGGLITAELGYIQKSCYELLE